MAWSIRVGPGIGTARPPPLVGSASIVSCIRGNLRGNAQLVFVSLISTFASAVDQMRFPLHIATDQIRYQIGQSLRGRKRYPFVLMLEPLYTCNLACIGCAIERHTGKLADRLPLEECLRAVDQSGAPTESICGGEPTLYPELPALIDGIVGRSRHISLCTNGLLLDTKVFGRIAPRKRLTINVHLDGIRETHDHVCPQPGV